MRSFLIIFLFSICSVQASTWSEVHVEDGVKVMQGQPKNGVLPFKAIGNIKVPFLSVVAAIKDNKKKHIWAPKVKRVTLHQEVQKNERIYSEFYSTPWPSEDRQFLLKDRLRVNSKKEFVLHAKSFNDPKLVDSDHTLSHVENLIISVKALSKHETEVSFTFHGDMKGMMPVWLMNKVQKKWGLRYIQALREHLAK